MNTWLSFKTDDFQKRERTGSAPKRNIPDTIDAYGDELNGAVRFSFKNTSEKVGLQYVRDFAKTHNLIIGKLDSYQTGDYHDDWIEVGFNYGT